MGETTERNLWALVLAGGDGTRLQAFTRLITGAPIPKQYCRILGRESLLEATVARAQLFASPERVVAIVNRDHLELARGQLRALACGNTIVQPCNRDTGPGMVSALVELERRDPTATVVVMPSDHFVGDDALFAASARRMIEAVERRPDDIALLGIRPEGPDPGFGYIVPSARHEMARVTRFEEKPSAPRAEQIIREGALWSSFIMAFCVGRMVDLLRRSRPRDVESIENLSAHPPRRSAGYARLTPWNFSRDFLQNNAAQLVVVRAAEFGWSDWGTPEAIERTVVSLGLNPPWLRRLADLTARPRLAAAAA